MKIEMRAAQKEFTPEPAVMNKIAGLLHHAAKAEGVPGCLTVTIGFTDDETIRRFNHRFRKLDKATDVLSFPMTAGRDEWQQAKKPLPGLSRPSLGDILISLEHCAAQAEEYGHGFDREICFLALHGFLHLLGYDHIEVADRIEMEAAADKYLTEMEILR